VPVCSRFGNLVTNASWKEFFLNEGFTMYAQRRITTLVHGEAFTALEADIGITLLKEEIDAAGHEDPLTKLQTPLAKGVDPDDTYNQTPYEKGYCLLAYVLPCSVAVWGLVVVCGLFSFFGIVEWSLLCFTCVAVRCVALHRYLRSLVGSDDEFDAFMREWSQGHKFQCVTSTMMFNFFFKKFPHLVRPQFMPTLAIPYIPRTHPVNRKRQ